MGNVPEGTNEHFEQGVPKEAEDEPEEDKFIKIDVSKVKNQTMNIKKIYQKRKKYIIIEKWEILEI